MNVAMFAHKNVQAGRITSQSPVALGKRKETPIDNNAASTLDSKLDDGTRRATSKRENSSSRGQYPNSLLFSDV
jgi:hypothetical protein